LGLAKNISLGFSNKETENICITKLQGAELQKILVLFEIFFSLVFCGGVGGGIPKSSRLHLYVALGCGK
jgi:hypothetical protein